jgi:autotransporter-associated beta strand protein
MKPKSIVRSIVAALGGSTLAISSASAATLYWDGNATQTANADGGAGTWTTGGTNWDDVPFGGADTAWADGETAIFGATHGAVTIGAGGVVVGGLTFITTTTTGYTLAAGTNGLNFSSGTNNITFAIHNANAAATISGTVGGTDANLVLDKQNLTRPATLTFSGISSGGWTGTTTIGQNATLASTTTSGNVNQVLNSTSGITLNGGAVQFNRATNAQLNAISDSAAITVNGGGTFGATSADAGGVNAIETIGAVTVNSGQMNFNWTNGASSGAQMILGASGTGNLVVNGTSSVTFSGNLGSTGRWKVTGGGSTGTDEIIGAWATTGGANGIGAQTDYAVYNSDFVAARGIAASAESTWSDTHAATSNFTMSAIDSGTISGGSGRNVNTIRSLNNAVSVTSGSPDITLTGHTLAVNDVVTFSAGTMPTGLTAGTAYFVVSTATDTIQVSATQGGTAITPTSTGATVVAAGAIQVSSGNNLGAFGILNGTATTLNILQDGGAGSVTLPTTDAGNLFVTAGAGAITIAAPIVDNTGALTLVKNGSNTLTLSGTNTYTGGTVLNAGTLAIGNVNHIGGAGAGLIFNGTATLAPSAALNFSSGTLTVNQGALATVANTNSVTFATTTGAGTLAFSGSVAHNIGNASGLTGTLALLQASGTQSVQFSSLNVNTAGSLLAFGGNAGDSNQRSSFIFNGSSPLTFAASGRQVAITPSTNQNGGARWNMLENNSGTAANTWVINSDLINTGVRGGISLVLAGSNTGNNAFNGVIGNSTLNNAALWIAKNGGGRWILDGNNTFTGRLVVSQGTISVDTFNNADTAGPLGKGQIQLGGTTRADGANGNGPFGDNSGTLQYTGGAVTTSRTVIIGDNQAVNTGGGTIANDSTTGAITFSAANFNSSAGAITATARTLTLAGTYTGGANEIQGVISNGTTSTGRINLAKSGASTWALSGANSYTGTTTISGGTLLVNGDSSLATGNVSVNGGTLGGTGTLGGAVTVAAAANIAPGASSAGTLTINGNLSISAMAGGAGLLNYELATLAASDKIVLPTGTLNIGTGVLGLGDLNLTNLGGLQNGTYKLIETSQPITGTLAGDTNGTLGAATIDLQLSGDGTDLELVVSGLGAGDPEIAVEEPISNDIANGGSRNFGTVTLGSSGSLTFTIRNTGSAGLDLTGTPPDYVAVSGANAGDFTVTAAPSTPVTSGGGTTTFTVQFAPLGTTGGTRNAVLTILNNDSDEGSFTINVSGTAQTQYDAWSGGAGFDLDTNGDGVDNGLAFLLGAANPNANALGLLPEVTEDNGNLVLNFSMLNAAARGTASLSIEHSSDLGIGDAWEAALVPDVDNTVNDVVFDITGSGPLDVEATIPSSKAVAGKLFGRLKAVKP